MSFGGAMERQCCKKSDVSPGPDACGWQHIWSRLLQTPGDVSEDAADEWTHLGSPHYAELGQLHQSSMIRAFLWQCPPLASEAERERSSDGLALAHRTNSSSLHRGVMPTDGHQARLGPSVPEFIILKCEMIQFLHSYAVQSQQESILAVTAACRQVSQQSLIPDYSSVLVLLPHAGELMCV